MEYHQKILNTYAYSYYIFVVQNHFRICSNILQNHEIIYTSFGEKCHPHRIASNDNEWYELILYIPKQIRNLFGYDDSAMNVPDNALLLWNEFKVLIILE